MALPCSLVVAAFAQLMQRVDRWPDLHFEAGLAWQHARSGYGGIAPALASLPPGFSQVTLVNDASQLWCEKHPAAKCRTECTALADAAPGSRCLNISYPDAPGTHDHLHYLTHDLHHLIPPLFEAHEQGARILVGPYTSSMANFLAPIAVGLGMALIAPAVTSAELTEASNGFTSFSRVAPSDAISALSLVQALASFGWRSVGVAYPNDSFGRNFATSLRQASATLRVRPLPTMPPPLTVLLPLTMVHPIMHSLTTLTVLPPTPFTRRAAPPTSRSDLLCTRARPHRTGRRCARSQRDISETAHTLTSSHTHPHTPRTPPTVHVLHPSYTSFTPLSHPSHTPLTPLSHPSHTPLTPSHTLSHPL